MGHNTSVLNFILLCDSLSFTHSVGTILAIPTSVIVDWIVQQYLFPWQAFIGIVLIVLGFGGFAFSEFFTASMEQRHLRLRERNQQKLIVTTSVNSNESSPLVVNELEKRDWRKNFIKHLI